MFCRNCGKEVFDEAVLCVNCGTLINSAALNLQVAPPSPAVASDTEAKNGVALTGFILSFLGVIGWLFSLLGLIFSIIGLVKSKQLIKGKGFGIAGIVISVVAFFVHGVIMALIMPYLIRIIAAPIFLIILLLFAV